MDLDATCQSGADEAYAELDLVDLNVVLHRADGEERDATGECLWCIQALHHLFAHGAVPIICTGSSKFCRTAGTPLQCS